MRHFRVKEFDDLHDDTSWTEMRGGYAEDIAGDYVDEHILPFHADHDYVMTFDIVVQETDETGKPLESLQRFNVQCEATISASCVEDVSETLEGIAST